MVLKIDLEHDELKVKIRDETVEIADGVGKISLTMAEIRIIIRFLVHNLRIDE